MLWIFGYSDSTAVAQTDTDMPGMTDQTITLDSGNHPLLPLPLWLETAYIMGLTVTRGRINTPKFRPVSRPLIRPIEQAAGPSGRPQIAEYWRHPIQFNAVEPISILRTNTTAVAERDFAFLTVGDRMRNTAQGDLYTLRLTTGFTPTVNAWTASGNVTFDDTLMQGVYEVQGMDLGFAGLVAARLAFPGPPLSGSPAQVRPGGVFPQNLTSQGTRYLRWGYLGAWGRFVSYAPPQLEVVSTAATANPECYWDVVRISDTMGAGIMA